MKTLNGLFVFLTTQRFKKCHGSRHFGLAYTVIALFRLSGRYHQCV